jgi:hypothetical protein
MSALLILGTVAVFPVTLTSQPTMGTVLWQNPSSIQRCSGADAAQAVEMSDYNASKGDGCTSSWFAFIPGSEGHNETAELQFYESHSASFAGVIMDDYFGQDIGIYQSLVSQGVDVCPVIYNALPMPAGLTDAACVIFAIGPGMPTYTAAEWESAMSNTIALAQARNVHILVYSSFNRDGVSVPVTAAYLKGAEMASAESHEFEVIWD